MAPAFLPYQSHEDLIDGVITDIDGLIGSVEYWSAVVHAPGGPVARARALTYDYQHQGRAADDGMLKATTEDIDQLLHWRATCCGIDSDTLASLLISRGGGTKVRIGHYEIEHDLMVGTSTNI